MTTTKKLIIEEDTNQIVRSKYITIFTHIVPAGIDLKSNDCICYYVKWGNLHIQLTVDALETWRNNYYVHMDEGYITIEDDIIIIENEFISDDCVDWKRPEAIKFISENDVSDAWEDV